MAGVRVSTDEVERLLGQAAKAASDLRPVWALLDQRITDNTEDQFRTRGGLTGGWPPLNPNYRALKARTAGWRTSIMERSGRLLASLSNPFHPAAVHRVKKLEYERGTALPYAAAHQNPLGKHLPKREVMVWRRQDNQWLADTIRDRMLGR